MRSLVRKAHQAPGTQTLYQGQLMLFWPNSCHSLLGIDKLGNVRANVSSLTVDFQVAPGLGTAGQGYGDASVGNMVWAGELEGRWEPRGLLWLTRPWLEQKGGFSWRWGWGGGGRSGAPGMQIFSPAKLSKRKPQTNYCKKPW